MHTLIVCNLGHFHAALALRNRHELLREEVFVYAEDGPDLERFLALVAAFNTRAQDPTAWQLTVYRGADHLDRLIAERRGNIVLLAGRNDTKMRTIARLQSEGFAVLGDKTWLIDEQELPLVRQVTAATPLALDMMTERWDIGNRLLRVLCADEAVFGGFRTATEAAITLVSVHNLFKAVNGAPLRRPPWYFDTDMQGEGITDVNTHLVDLALWFTDAGEPCDDSRDLRLRGARQWPTAVPLAVFRDITGLEDFPAALRPRVREGALRYLCNAEVDFDLRGIGVRLEALWGLAEAPGGGDEFSTVLEGQRARLLCLHDRDTAFQSVVKVLPRTESGSTRAAVEAALARHAGLLPGVGVTTQGAALVLTIPAPLRTTHEQHFAKVLDAFLRQVQSGELPRQARADLLAKYALLARARAAAAREA